MDLLVISNKNKSHYVYIKDFNRFICNKRKGKSKKHFCRYCLQSFSGAKVLVEQKNLFKNKWSANFKNKKWFN